MDLEAEKKAAVKVIQKLTNTDKNVQRVDVGTKQEVKPSLKEIPLEQRKPREPSQQEKLQQYLTSIGQL